MKDAVELGRELYALGARLGSLGTVAVGSGGGPLARMLARLVGCGAALAGGEVKFYDGSCAACGAWLRRHYSLPMAVFLRQEEDQVEVYLLDGRAGRTAPVGTVQAAGPAVEEWDLLTGADCAWAASRVGGRRRQGLVSALGPAALTLMLERMGHEVLDRSEPGIPLFRADREGFRLWVEREGLRLCPAGEDALAAAADLAGEWSAAAQPEAVPAVKQEEGGPGPV